jgi:hypothetical protein
MEKQATENLTLAKALSVKNRLAGRLAQAKVNVETYNSVLVGQKDEAGASGVDARAEYDRFLRLQEGLVVVKAAIQRSNVPIYEDVLRLAEKKALLQVLNGLNTKQGTEPGYGGIEYRYAATIQKPEVLEIVRRIEAEIDMIQDGLTQFNASTMVEIARAVLDLAR